MTQDRKPTLFASMFGSKKKTEEELKAEKESRQKLEDRIREVLVVNETPNLEPVLTIWTPNSELETTPLHRQ